MSEKTNGEENAPVQEIINESSKNRLWSATLLPGLFLILLGFYFLANKLTGFNLDNWWALFILFPAINNFSAGFSAMRRDGNLSRSARGHFFWSLILLLLATALLLGVNFGLLWPVFIILAGIGVLLGAF